MAAANHTSDPYADEQWKTISGFEDYYEVSDHGRVRGLDRVVTDSMGLTIRKRRLRGRIIIPASEQDRYLFVRLCRNGGNQKVYIHRLVAEAFIGPCPTGMEVLHWDDDKRNNRVSNLRWGTRSDNLRDLVRNGNHVQANKTHCPRGHVLEEPNLVPSVLKAGRRSCLACQRTHSYLGNHPEMKPDFKIISDQYYEAILRSAPAA